MPIFKIQTNVPKDKVPEDFVDKIVPILAKVMQKPKEHFICVVTPDLPISMFLDSKRPVAISTLESIGSVGPDQNTSITSQLADFIEKELGVNPERFLITFYDLEPYNVALNRMTVQDKNS